MGFEIVDGYLLGTPISKAAVVAALLEERSDDPAAAPFYRALEAVGVRAADEAFVALRLVLAGRAPDDAAVRHLRALSGVARACARGDASGLAALLRREPSLVTALGGSTAPVDLAARGSAAAEAFAAALVPRP